MIYDIIGKLLVYGTWISIAIVLISLLFGYIALKKRIIFYSLFSGVLDIFYMPLRTIYSRFGKESVLDKLMVSLKNNANEKKFRQAKKRIVVAPHCMRHIDCPAKSTRTGIQCISCGRCPYTEIKKKCDKKGIQLFIVTGSSAVKHIAKTQDFDSVIGIGCYYELNKMGQYLSIKAIPGKGIPLKNDGCYNTKVDLRQVNEIIDS